MAAEQDTQAMSTWLRRIGDLQGGSYRNRKLHGVADRLDTLAAALAKAEAERDDWREKAVRYQDWYAQELLALAETREALRPFVESSDQDGMFAGAWVNDPDDEWVTPGNVQMGDLRRARAALAGPEAKA